MPTETVAFDEETAPYAVELARVRTFDLCALHDVAAAERITGSTRAALRLNSTLASCDLELRSARAGSSWQIELSVGPAAVDGWTPITLAGTRLRTDPTPDVNCEYLAPLAGSVGLKIEGDSTSSGAQASICRTVERYLAEVVLPRWANPPKLADGLTAPHAPLLGKDPCRALAAGIAEVPTREPKTYALSDPYSCAGGRGSAIRPYSVSFKVFSAVLDLQGAPIRLGAFNAYRAGGVGSGGCSYQIAVQPAFVFSAAEGTRYNAGIVIGLPDCAQVDVARKVLDDLVRQPDAPEGRPGAQPIGDLSRR